MKDRTLSDVLKTRWKGDENYRHGVSDTIELLNFRQNILFPVVFYGKDKLCPGRTEGCDSSWVDQMTELLWGGYLKEKTVW